MIQAATVADGSHLGHRIVAEGERDGGLGLDEVVWVARIDTTLSCSARNMGTVRTTRTQLDQLPLPLNNQRFCFKYALVSSVTSTWLIDTHRHAPSVTSLVLTPIQQALSAAICSARTVSAVLQEISDPQNLSYRPSSRSLKIGRRSYIGQGGGLQ